MLKHPTINSLFTDIADAIRYKTKTTDKIIADDFPDVIKSMKSGFPNGMEWTKSKGMINEIIEFYFANGIWMTCGPSSVQRGRQYSVDGKMWESKDLYPFACCHNANGVWVAGSGAHDGLGGISVSVGLRYSTDGMTWKDSNVQSGFFSCIYNANGIWVAGGSNGIYYSTDGKTWTQSSVQTKIYSVYNANGIWVAFGVREGIYTSTDGVNWDVNVDHTVESQGHISYANGIWVSGSPKNFTPYITPSLKNGLSYSNDGKNWYKSNITSGDFRCIYNANGIWVAGGSNGIYYSTDGKTWTQSNITNLTICLHNANGIWLASTSLGLRYSIDGKIWAATDWQPKNSFKALSYANGIWVAAGADGLYYSVAWEP